MAHTLYEKRNLNSAKDLFEGLAGSNSIRNGAARSPEHKSHSCRSPLGSRTHYVLWSGVVLKGSEIRLVAYRWVRASEEMSSLGKAEGPAGASTRTTTSGPYNAMPMARAICRR